MFLPNPMGDDGYNRHFFGRVPRFDRAALGVDGLLERYCNDNGMLNNGIPLDSVRSFAWRQQFSESDDDNRCTSGRPFAALRGDFALAANRELYRLRTFDVIPSTLNVDMFVNRTEGEVGYVQRLIELPANLNEQWRGRVMVEQRALCFVKPQLRVKFRYLAKDSRHWKVNIRGERRARLHFGRAIPHHCMTQFHITDDAVADAWPRLTRGSEQIEVPTGRNVELSPIFSYKGSSLIDRESNWWVVAYTELIAKNAAFILFDVYDSLHLWALSPKTIELCPVLDLTQVLGNNQNVQEFLRLLTEIEFADFREYPSDWCNRGTCFYTSKSPGRADAGAEFIYYCPYARRSLSLNEFVYKRRLGRPEILPNQVRGLDFSVQPEGWSESSGRRKVDERVEGDNDDDVDDDVNDDGLGWGSVGAAYVAPTVNNHVAIGGSNANIGGSISPTYGQTSTVFLGNFHYQSVPSYPLPSVAPIIAAGAVPTPSTYYSMMGYGLGVIPLSVGTVPYDYSQVGVCVPSIVTTTGNSESQELESIRAFLRGAGVGEHHL